MTAAADLLIRLMAMFVVFAVVFGAPGWVVAARLEPTSTPARRWALAFVLGPAFVGRLAWAASGVTGIFLDVFVVGICGLLLIVASPGTARDLRRELRTLRARVYRRPEGEPGPDAFPVALGIGVVGYYLLKFDSMYFHTLGTNAGVMHALGFGLGETTPAQSSVLSGGFPQPEGQIEPAAAFAAAFGYPGLRLWFAVTLLGLAMVTFHAALRLGSSRRLATGAAAFAAFNPYTMAMNQVDGLENVLPALWVGVFALMAAGPDREHRGSAVALGVVAGFLGATRHVFFLGLLPAAWVSGRAQAPRFLVAAGVTVLWIALQHILAGRPLLLDEGLHPLPVGADGGWWWTGPLLAMRMPYAAFPPWLLLPLAATCTYGTVALVLGCRAIRPLSRSPAARMTFALVAPALMFIGLHGAVLQDEQLARPALLIVPIALTVAVGLRTLQTRRAWTTTLGAAMVLSGAVRLLASVPFPIDERAYASFERLLPEPDGWAAVERASTTSALPVPAYTPDVLIDPLIVGQGKRWRDLGYELRHPGFEHRYLSLNEKRLAFHRGDLFTKTLQPNHPRLHPEARTKDQGDPYDEERPMTVGLDLKTALTQQLLWVDCRRQEHDDVVLDMARMRGPVRLDIIMDGVPDVALYAFKEYLGPKEVEVALMAVPLPWAHRNPGVAAPLEDGVLRFLVPGRTSLSYTQILGEEPDTTELLVGLQWHAAMRCEDGPGVFGPFRR